MSQLQMPMTGRLFDVYLAVDWSARSAPSPRRPSPDSVWVAECTATAGRTSTHYLRTRHACGQWLRRRLRDHVAHGRRVLAGFDFPFGFPAGFAAALGRGCAAAARRPHSGKPHREDPAGWRLIWDELDELIEDAPDNGNNRFAVATALNLRCGPAPGPLWGCPRARAGPYLAATSPGYPYPVGGLDLRRLRWAELPVPGTQSAWKLMGIGSVGSQCLLGIPFVARLRSDPLLRDVSRVWPFETRAAGSPPPGGASVLYAEIWPGIVRRLSGARELTAQRNAPPAMIKDQAQVREVVRWLRSADESGALESMLDAPGRLPARVRRDVLGEEGWILGAYQGSVP